MSTPQAGILLPLPPLARYLAFDLEPGTDVAAGLAALQGIVDGERTVAGIGMAPPRRPWPQGRGSQALSAPVRPRRGYPLHALRPVAMAAR